MKDLRLTEIWIYPVKSLGGIRLQSAKVMGKGLQHDRRFMLVDEQGVFLTQRVFPKMALFQLSINNDQLSIQYHGESISVSLVPRPMGESKPVQIWDDVVKAYEVSEEYNQWFSERLEMKCKLVFFPEDNARPVDPAYKVNDEHVSLADAYPFLIIGQSSLDDLNSRLTDPLPMNRFRPNLVFSGGEAFEEDTWRNFIVGSNRFVGVKLCSRCVLITVNQDTGEKGIEPTKTLATYRVIEGKIRFGQNLVALDHGSIQVGDQITLQ